MIRKLILSQLQTAVEVNGGVYQVQVAMLEFDDIPPDANPDSSETSTGTAPSSDTPTAASSHRTKPDLPINSVLSLIENGRAAYAHPFGPGTIFCWVFCFLAFQHLHFTSVRRSAT